MRLGGTTVPMLNLDPTSSREAEEIDLTSLTSWLLAPVRFTKGKDVWLSETR